MSKLKQEHRGRFSAAPDEPLFGVIAEEGGREIVRYFTDERELDAALPPESVQRALELAGAWSDLDWDEMEAALDRIRHESPPTPPIGHPATLWA